MSRGAGRVADLTGEWVDGVAKEAITRFRKNKSLIYQAALAEPDRARCAKAPRLQR
jgi:hypothetical protein